MNSNNDKQDMEKGFYRAFEDKFRGSREVIKSYLMVYLPFLLPLKEIYKVCTAVDLGCGRGEWLELLTEMGFAAHGVDLDDSMLAACRERNLSAETGDAISYLKSLSDESQTIVSGFHIIEHIAFGDMQILIQEAFRVLKPAGLLILETPNPENFLVSSTNFYLDPSHLHPIPPSLLAFLTDYHGFSRNKILRLHEDVDPDENIYPSLLNVLYRVSLDYAVVAQKPGDQERVAVFRPLFDREYGLSLEAAVRNYDAQVAQEFKASRAEFSRINAELARLSIIQTQLNDLYQSQSWRITAPLRAIADFMRKVGRKLLLRGAGKKVLTNTANYIRAHPALKKPLVRLFGLFPVFDRRVLQLSRQLQKDSPESQGSADEIQNQPLRVQQIHHDLVETIEQNKGGQ
jgi:O-antigen chain-terminating methyltransferase